MAEMDWDAHAEVQCRDDGGSDLYYDFKTLKTGSFADMIRWVLALPSVERARVIIDARGIGSHNIHDITLLSQRDDFPTG